MGKIDEGKKLYNLQHAVCNGFIDLCDVSNTHYALLCRKCGLRIVLPNDIDTWRKLEKFCKQALKG